SDNVREVLKYVPLDRMMVETDCPYLAPVPVRGRENEPAIVRYTLNFISDFMGVTQSQLASITTQNFEDLYQVKLQDPQAIDVRPDLTKIEKIAADLAE
ncbi:MAG TPA: TatD family deoxyribonuclease, partial [Succinivibrionaceae bacterium]|nr:TatD family deoxyribonuclease [Succinivibrionaceae bacterium]